MKNRQLGIFLVVGSLTALVDFITYRILLWQQFTDINSSKIIGFVTGTLFSYIANRFWTFNRQLISPGSFWRFLSVYFASLTANIFTNHLALDFFLGSSFKLYISFLLATSVSATLNFLGMKLFVFRSIVTQ